jgi:hypothetical protein
MRRFDQSSLEDADLGRYLGAFVPPPGTAEHFFKDPVQVEFVVDHLRELAAAYDSCLTMSARRTDAPRGTPPEHLAPVVTSVSPPTPTSPGLSVAPLGLAALTVLDRGRLELALAQDASQAPCPLPSARGRRRLGAGAARCLRGHRNRGRRPRRACSPVPGYRGGDRPVTAADPWSHLRQLGLSPEVVEVPLVPELPVIVASLNPPPGTPVAVGTSIVIVPTSGEPDREGT